MNPMITRGLWIPDPNFRFGTGSGTAWTEGTSMGARIVRVPNSFSSGATTRISLDGITISDANSLTSGYTPFGVAASPYLSGSSAIEFLIMAMVNTSGITSGNTNWLVQGTMTGYTSTGSSTEADATFFKDTDGDFFTYAPDWMLITCHLSVDTNSSTDWYKIKLEFRDDSVSSSNDFIHIAWVGVSVPYDASTPGDYLDSFYGADCSLSMQANPLGMGGLVRTYTLPWPTMDSADKFTVDECIAWNSKIPTTGAITTSSGTTQNISNNGAAQPLIIAIDREDYKGAFYANLAPASFAPNAVGFWPSSGAKHATALTFIEQDRPRA